MRVSQNLCAARLQFMKTVKVTIKGRVQGVFYRMWAKKTAENLGLSGTVRNLENGDVEALLQGKKDSVNKMIERCKEGSRLAMVDKVKVEKLENEPVIEGFEIIG